MYVCTLQRLTVRREVEVVGIITHISAEVRHTRREVSGTEDEGDADGPEAGRFGGGCVCVSVCVCGWVDE